jgi:hypothetical protein
MQTYGGVDVQIQVFLTSTLLGGELSALTPGRFIAGERAPVAFWIGGWVGPNVGLDDVENREFLTLPGLELQLLGRLACSQSLYRLLHTQVQYRLNRYIYINIHELLTKNARSDAVSTREQERRL